MSNTGQPGQMDRDDAHMDGLPDGCGCAEVWEHLSDVRRNAADD